jgi:hypothetical protein
VSLFRVGEALPMSNQIKTRIRDRSSSRRGPMPSSTLSSTLADALFGLDPLCPTSYCHGTWVRALGGALLPASSNTAPVHKE